MTSDQASNQAQAYAERLEREQPRLAVSRMTRSLRTGKVLIDWSQNNGSKTTVAPYSLRARQFPPSPPRHLGRGRSLPPAPDLFFTAPDTLTRVTDHGDLFAPCSPRNHCPPRSPRPPHQNRHRTTWNPRYHAYRFRGAAWISREMS